MSNESKPVPTIKPVPIGTLVPYQQNAKQHPKKQIQQIADSIERFGFITPIVTDETNTIIAGHGRWEAAKLLQLEKVPVISVDHLTEAEIKAYRLADNQLTLNSGYDDGLLRIELGELMAMDLDFDITLTGFETAEIDLLLGAIIEDAADHVPELDTSQPAVTKPGDLWQLGDHRLYCGDALQQASYDVLMAGAKARAVFTDPPYNVAIEGHAGNKGKIKHREFAMAAGEMSEEAFTAFLYRAHKLMQAHMMEGGIAYSCMDWRHLREVLQATQDAKLDLINVCVWAKTNGGMGSFYRSQHELVLVLKNGTAKHINNVQLGKHGRNRTNVWHYAGVNSFNAERQADLKLHPTVKPVQMVADAILDCSNRQDIVLDPFAGSGTTLIAAEQTGRQGRLIELDPLYCDVIVRRWQQLTGKTAVHAASSQTYAQRHNTEANHD